MARLDTIEIHPQISFDYCIKCTICNTVCPVTPIYPEFPGPKYTGPDSERFRIQQRYAVEAVSTYCINCKRCETICPSDVKITHFIEQDKFKQKKSLKKKLRGMFFTYIDFVGKLATKFSLLVNFTVKLGFVRILLDAFMGIARKRQLPTYSKQSFQNYFRKKYKAPKNAEHKIFFFHGCYVNYNDLELGKDFIEFCRIHHVEIQLFEQKCCGIPIASAGDSAAYEKRVDYNFQRIWPLIKNNGMIVAISSTCSMAIKTDYLRHIPLSDSDKEIYQDQIFYFNDFVEYLEREGTKLKIKRKYPRLVYHVPCHVKYSGEMANTIALLQRITDDLVVFNENCCGIGGSYGVKSETYGIAQSVGQLLFDKLDHYRNDIWVSECETCRMQITENTNHKVYHPLSLIVRDIT